MKSYFLSLLGRLLIKKGMIIFILSLLAGSTAVIAIGNNTQKTTNQDDAKSIFLQEGIILSPSPKVLIPMPKSQVDVAFKKVKSSRDPFQEPKIIETSKLELLHSVLEFKGIAKHGDSLVAMIKTSKAPQMYKVGDSIGNGFNIKEISASDITVDISNGLRHYRLYLDTLRK